MRRQKILYLDDDTSKVQEYKEYLEKLGFEVSFFSEVEPAARWLDEHSAQLDCVILDVMLPHGERYSAASTDAGLLTGLFFYREIRSRCGPKLPIFFLTNSSDPAITAAIRGDPAASVYLKPQVIYDAFGDLVLQKIGGLR